MMEFWKFQKCGSSNYRAQRHILPMQDAPEVKVNNDSFSHKSTYARIVSKLFVDSVKKALSQRALKTLLTETML